MSNHTPGPWTLGETDRNEQPTVVALDGGVLVAVCAHECITSLIPEAIANARLIAAAPDLLEALKAIIAELRRVRDVKPEQWDALVDPGLCNAWDAIRSAVTKAEGR